MLKVIGLLTKKRGLATRDLIDYYEHHHVPLVLSQAPPPIDFRRNYVMHDPDDASPDDGVDVVVELVFPDRMTYRAWLDRVYAERSGVAADEMTFLDRSKSRTYLVEEHIDTGPFDGGQTRTD